MNFIIGLIIGAIVVLAIIFRKQVKDGWGKFTAWLKQVVDKIKSWRKK